MSNAKPPRVQYRCSFCGKSQDQVHRLIAGPGEIYICNECVALCGEILEEEQRVIEGHAQTEGAVRSVNASAQPGVLPEDVAQLQAEVARLVAENGTLREQLRTYEQPEER